MVSLDFDSKSLNGSIADVSYLHEAASIAGSLLAGYSVSGMEYAPSKWIAADQVSAGAQALAEQAKAQLEQAKQQAIGDVMAFLQYKVTENHLRQIVDMIQNCHSVGGLANIMGSV